MPSWIDHFFPKHVHWYFIFSAKLCTCYPMRWSIPVKTVFADINNMKTIERRLSNFYWHFLLDYWWKMFYALSSWTFPIQENKIIYKISSAKNVLARHISKLSMHTCHAYGTKWVENIQTRNARRSSQRKPFNTKIQCNRVKYTNREWPTS